ncbi:MAG: DUF3822 family protein [Microscillaceae bacterium]|nr:DUF3822 family protein [Microscillaceae bacterium]
MINQKTYTQEASVRSELFDIDQLSQYVLCLAIGAEGLRFCAIDQNSRQCLMLQHYQFFKKLAADDWFNTLHRIYDNDLFLKANYWQNIEILILEQPFSLVPREFFEESAPDRYLKYSHPKSPAEVVVVTEQPGTDAFSVFYLEKKLLEWFRKMYPGREIDFNHTSAAFIAGINRQFPDLRTPSLHVLVEGRQMVVVYFSEGNLRFCNVFGFQQPADILYYLFFTMDELRLEKEKITTYLYGMVLPDSEIYRTLKLYLSDLVLFRQNPNWIKFHHGFDEIHNHFYFGLYTAFLCQDE